VVLEWGPLSLVNITKELLGRNNSGFGLENLDYGLGDPPLWLHDTISPKLALTSPTSGGHSVDIVRSRTKAKELFSYYYFICVVESTISVLWIKRLREDFGETFNQPHI
jgi:hypothetical protein